MCWCRLESMCLPQRMLFAVSSPQTPSPTLSLTNSQINIGELNRRRFAWNCKAAWKMASRVRGWRLWDGQSGLRMWLQAGNDPGLGLTLLTWGRVRGVVGLTTTNSCVSITKAACSALTVACWLLSAGCIELAAGIQLWNNAFLPPVDAQQQPPQRLAIMKQSSPAEIPIVQSLTAFPYI